jgi:hypothetical protein
VGCRLREGQRMLGGTSEMGVYSPYQTQYNRTMRMVDLE